MLTGAGRGVSIGIGVTDLDEVPNHCVHEYFSLNYFWARKWLLTRFSTAFVVFPGGLGTLDELFEILTLIQTKKMGPVPIILVGTEYWKKFFEWVQDELVTQHSLAVQEDLKLFTVVDDINQVFHLVHNECKIS